MKRALALVFLVACARTPAAVTHDAGGSGGTGGDPGAFLRVDGTRIVDGLGAPVHLRGIAFGNEVWTNKRIPNTHHDERDFQRVADMGMNLIRFYLNHVTFQDPAHPGVWLDDGWQWIDQNVAWARKHGIRLFLNMHVPPGGFQSQGEGNALWDDPAMQDQLVALWTAIASRYKDEPFIAGFDLLNEPVVTKDRTQWVTLAKRLVTAIRQVDTRHIIIVERTNAVAGSWANDADQNFFKVDDPNVLYEFHVYEPFAYTHQFASWVKLGEGGPYPDPTRLESGGSLTWLTGTFDNPKLPAGDTPWTFYEAPRFVVQDPAMKAAKPALVASRAGGSCDFDDIALAEYAPDGSKVRDVFQVNLVDPAPWWFWSKDGKGMLGKAPDGHGDAGSIRLQGTIDDANAGNDGLRFVPRQGYAYAISGWMRGTGVSATAVCQIRLDFETSDGPLPVRDKAFLGAALDRFVGWGARNGVPVYLGEFGVIAQTFQNDRGGLRWVNDMLDLVAERDVTFTYHVYHEDAFGLYQGYGTLPDPARANQPLIDLFTMKLLTPKP